MQRRLLIFAVCVVLMIPVVSSNHVQSGSGRIVVFDHKVGNEWWVETVLSGQDAGQVSKVEARDDGGPWVPLTFRSWGAWAASFHIEPGHRVQFRASWAGGAMQDSCWFTHPAGTEQCAQPFHASFTLVKGNEWWVQSQVTPSTGNTVSSVHVSADGGTWQPLRLQSWGVREWAASYHLPEGTVVQLRATNSAGVTSLSGCYRWIPPQTGGQDAQPVACPPLDFDASFQNVRGNEWWVETDVKANAPIASVFARVDCTGMWRSLTLRSWGSWAASFHVPAGSKIDLRAVSTSGAEDLSDGYVWPQATPTASCVAGAWPVEGSSASVRFRGEEEWLDADGRHFLRTDGLVHTEFVGGAWTGTCEYRHEYRAPSGTWTNGTRNMAWDRAPPVGELPATPGANADVETVKTCTQLLHSDQPVVGRENRTFSIRTNSGDPVPISAYHTQWSDPATSGDLWWDDKHGLVLSWRRAVDDGTRLERFEGWLLDTDASWS